MTLEVSEAAMPITTMAFHTAETLGLDPLLVANEGKIVIVCREADASAVLAACHGNKYGERAVIVGRFVDSQPALVELISRAGGRRIVQRPYGQELPRIC